MSESPLRLPHPIRRRVFSSLLILAGCALYSLAVVLFIIPSNLMMGGVTGISLVINRLLSLPVGILILVINIPLFIAGYKSMGRDFFIGSLLGMVLSSVLIDVFEAILPAMPELATDRLLASVLGGAVSGAGLGLVMAAGASTGGTDIVALLVSQKTETFSLGRLILISDIVIVLGGVLVLRDAVAALYTAVMMYAAAAALDGVLYGVNIASVVLVVTSKPENLAQTLMQTLDRGLTVLPAKGGYTNKESTVLLCSIGRRQLGLLKQIVRQEDPAAFVIVQEAKEVMGHGFKEFI